MAAGNVVALRVVECVYQDAGPIVSLYRDLGAESAERVVRRALGELNAELSFMIGRIEAHETEGLPRQLRRLQRLSENLGLSSLNLAAGNARDCLAEGDATAFAAVWARLMRVADSSLATEAFLMDKTLV